MKTLNELFEASKSASRSLLLLKDTEINNLLNCLASAIEQNISAILAENAKDLAKMDADNPKYDRLKLTKERIQGIINDIRHVSKLPSPLGKILEDKTLENGLHLIKKSVPFGVIGVIFEARPNVCFDVFSLCFKSGNASILKGGSDAFYSNTIIVSIIRQVLNQNGVDPNCCILLPNERAATTELLNAQTYIDLIIPRGGKSLIQFVRENSKVPVIETGAGVCHTYIHENANLEMAKKIVYNAKTRRVSVCNALDCLLIDKYIVNSLPLVCNELATKNVIIYADEKSYAALKENYPNELLKEADSNCFGTEFLDYKMAIKCVNGIDEAINHIEKYGSKHSEAIITDNQRAANIFESLVDAACVYVNASTAFTDGAQFGLGAEIGISTQKMHARGPMALQEICCYKWIIEGKGQVRIP